MVKKAELHVHLEGTMTPDLAMKIALRNQLKLVDGLIGDTGQTYQFDDFLHFLSVYDQVADVIRVPQDYYDMTYDYLMRNAQDDVIYIELMYSPEHAEKVSGIPSSEHLAAIDQAIDDARAQSGIEGRIIMTGVRHFGVEAVEKVAQEAIKKTSQYIVGFGLGGDEAGFPPKLFEKAYRMAHEAGLGCTVHAGEFSNHLGMLEALTYLPIQRVGHGLHALKDAELTARMKEKHIAIESCPTSSVCFGLFPHIDVHPFQHIYKSGIQVSLNSDDPPFVDTTVGKEYALVQQAFGLTDEDLLHITHMAIDSAFVDEATKMALKAKL